MNKKTIRDVDVYGKRTLLRVDFNVPKNADTGSILDDSRIRASLPTIRYLVEGGARLIVCSHMGRPKGMAISKETLRPVAMRLQDLLGMPVRLVEDMVGDTTPGIGGVVMLENLRFHPGEEANDPVFAKRLASIAEIYVNDAFGAAHRAHASTEGVAQFLTSVAGFLMERELEVLGRALSSPMRPMATIVGGAKVSDKIGMLEHMVGVVESILVGGGMVATFIKAKGLSVGGSFVEDDSIGKVTSLQKNARERNVQIRLPLDLVVAQEFSASAPSRIVPAGAIPKGHLIMDIGPQTRALFASELRKCKTVVWNGPMGVFEMPRFSKGTESVARVVASLDATTIVGGGSTAQAIHDFGLEGHISHVSTGGGASLEYLEGKTLPGVAVLQDREENKPI